MAAQRRTIHYSKTFERDETGTQPHEIEALLARLVAQAYLAEHPHLLTGERPEGCDETAGAFAVASARTGSPV